MNNTNFLGKNCTPPWIEYCYFCLLFKLLVQRWFYAWFCWKRKEDPNESLFWRKSQIQLNRLLWSERYDQGEDFSKEDAQEEGSACKKLGKLQQQLQEEPWLWKSGSIWKALSSSGYSHSGSKRLGLRNHGLSNVNFEVSCLVWEGGSFTSHV